MRKQFAFEVDAKTLRNLRLLARREGRSMAAQIRYMVAVATAPQQKRREASRGDADKRMEAAQC